jgi:hypothetical protein
MSTEDTATAGNPKPLFRDVRTAIEADALAKDQILTVEELNRLSSKTYMSHFFLGYALYNIVQNFLGMIWGTFNDRPTSIKAVNRLRMSLLQGMIYSPDRAIPALVRPEWIPIELSKTFVSSNFKTLEKWVGGSNVPGPNDPFAGCGGAHRRDAGESAQEECDRLAEMAQKKQYSARDQLEKKRAMKKPNESLMKELAKAEKG